MALRARGNTFGALAFISYGSFWLAYWWITTTPGVAHDAGTGGIGSFLLLWCIFTGMLVVPCIRISVLLTALFTAATITFALLAIATLASSDTLTRAAGCTGLVVGALGFYGCFASVVNATWRRALIPMGSRE
jgi:succinate-acetate transporter protein